MMREEKMKIVMPLDGMYSWYASGFTLFENKALIMTCVCLTEKIGTWQTDNDVKTHGWRTRLFSL